METRNAPSPGKVRTRPVGGVELLSSRHFPDDMQGHMIVLNTIGFRGLLNYKLTEDGAGLQSTEVEPILSSADENFRPVDAEVGPDGALYFADWHNPIIGHMQHNLRDTSRDHDHGRIYRVTYPGRPLLKPAVIAGASIPRLLDLLKEPEDRVRYRAKIELSGRDSKEVVAAVQAWIGRLDSKDPQYEHQMMEALWVHQWHNVVNEQLLTRMLKSSNPWARAAATRVLCYWRDRVADPLALLKVLANDPHPGVRLEAVRAASFFQTPDAAKVALESLNQPQDRFLKYTLDQTMNTLKKFMNSSGMGSALVVRIVFVPVVLLLAFPPAVHSDPQAAGQEPAPRILLDAAPRAIEYQLGRLSNAELSRVERKPDDPRYRLVYYALLTRKGLGREYVDEALAALIKMDKASQTTVLLEALSKIDAEDEEAAGKLLKVLLGQPIEELRRSRDALTKAIEAAPAAPGTPWVLQGAYGGSLLAATDARAVWDAAAGREGHTVALLR